MIGQSHISLYRATSKVCVIPFLVLTRIINITTIVKLLVLRVQTNTPPPNRSILSYIYESRLFTIKLLVPRRRTNTTRPHRSISRYILSTCVLQGFTCVPTIGTRAYETSPSRSSWLLRVHQVRPCRRPDNGHCPLSNGVWNQVHTWALPTVWDNRYFSMI